MPSRARTDFDYVSNFPSLSDESSSLLTQRASWLEVSVEARLGAMKKGWAWSASRSHRNVRIHRGLDQKSRPEWQGGAA